MPHGPGERGAGALAKTFGSEVDRVRDQGYGAFTVVDRAMKVADLVFDSIVDSPAGHDSEVRHLRFAGPACTVEVDVIGGAESQLEVRALPVADTVEVRTTGAKKQSAFALEPGDTLVCPTLTSLVIRWAHPEVPPIRTAWVLL